MNKQTINPSEAAEQEALFRWADFAKSKFPELEMMFHVPNEGKRSVINGASLKRQGLKKGVPDIFILAPKGKYHGMAIEMKKIGQKPTKEQKQFLAELEKQGYYCYLANKGWSDAAERITNYLNVECAKNEL